MGDAGEPAPARVGQQPATGRDEPGRAGRCRVGRTRSATMQVMAAAERRSRVPTATPKMARGSQVQPGARHALGHAAMSPSVA